MPDLPFAQARGLPTVLANWKTQGAIEPLLTLDRALIGRDADWADIPGRLPESLIQALKRRNIDALYTHQSDAIGSALMDQHTIIATPTSSGKSLCFHLPVLTRLLEDASATALYLYPTKALSRDQEHSLQSLV
ncbi:MAG TPA: DEAD/DEAH box helicase, partial [Polyangiaceae bacterium]